MALRQIIVPDVINYDFGIGVDLGSGSPMNKAVEGEVSGVAGAGGAGASFSIDRITSTEELEKKLGIDVDASYGCGAFGAGLSAKFNFAKDQKIQSSSLFLAVTASVQLANLSIDAPKLTAAAAGVADNPPLFEQRYGNMFVRGVTRGGIFVGAMRIDTFSSQDSMNIAAELSGSYGLFSADAKVKFEEIQKKYHTEIHINVHHVGGPVNLQMTDPQNPLELLGLVNKFLDSFQNAPDQNAVPFSFALAPISIAEGPLPPNAADIELAQDVVVMCAKARSTILDKINLLDFILTNDSRYDFPAPTTIDTVKTCLNAYQEDLATVAGCASQAINDCKKAAPPAVYAQSKQTTFPKGEMPNPMPTLKPPPAEAPVNLKTIPRLYGTPEAEASVLLSQLGLSPVTSHVQSGMYMEGHHAPIGTVQDTNPPESSQVAEGTKVTLRVIIDAPLGPKFTFKIPR